MYKLFLLYVVLQGAGYKVRKIDPKSLGVYIYIYIYTRIFVPRFARPRFYRLTFRQRFYNSSKDLRLQVEKTNLKAFRPDMCLSEVGGSLCHPSPCDI
jgi:hypothetical protein